MSATRSRARVLGPTCISELNTAHFSRHGCDKGRQSAYVISAHRKSLIYLLQIEGVLCRKAGKTLRGTVHLTAHHLIFVHDNKVEEELWVSLKFEFLNDSLPVGS